MGSAVNSTVDVGDAPPESLPVKLPEAEVAVEAFSIRIDRVDDRRPCSELSPAAHAAPERVDEKCTTQSRTPFAAVEGEPRKQHHGDRIRHPPPKTSRRARTRDGAHSQLVVADDPVSTTQHVRRSRARSAGSPRRLPQPAVQRLDAGAEAIDLVLVPQRLDRPERISAQCAGIWLCLPAYLRTTGISSGGPSRAATKRSNASAET